MGNMETMARGLKIILGVAPVLGLGVASCGNGNSADVVEPTAISKAEADGPGCESTALAKLVSDICGHPFILADSDVQTGDGKCSVELLSAEFGSKYGANGVSPTVKYEKSYRKPGSNGRNMAKFTYETALNREKGRGNYKQDVASLGEEAFYAEVSSNRNVYWHDGGYFHILSVGDGHRGDSNYKPYCPPQELPRLAREIQGN